MPLCSYPTNGLVSTIATDHQACMLQLHLTSSHVFISCILSAYMYVTVSSYQHPCILNLNPTSSHVLNNCIRPFAMSFTVPPNQQTSIYICYSNIQPSVLSVAFAPDQYSNNGCYNCIVPADLYFTVTPNQQSIW